MVNKYVPASGPIGPKLAIVIDAPSYEDVDAEKLCQGAMGRELNRLLKDAGINREECWITSISKYFVPPQPFGEKKKPFQQRCAENNINLEEQIIEFKNELNQVNPNCLLVLGGSALWSLTGHYKILDYRGSILTGIGGYKLVATFNPVDLVHQARGEITDYWQRKVIIFDMQRAFEESRTKELILPSRYLHVCHSSSELLDFTERHKSYVKPAIDIEAHPDGSCIPICVGVSYTPHEGITIPLWNVDGISTIPDGDLVSIWLMVSKILNCEEGIIGQNFGYDRTKLKGIGFSIKKLASDLMLKSFCINPELPKNLAFNTSIYTREPFYKNEGMYEGNISDLFIGCARDSCVTKEIDMAMDPDMNSLGTRDFYEQFILPLHDLYMDIEAEGFYRDKEIHDKLVKKYVEWNERINYELFKLAGDTIVNTASWKQVDKLLYDTWSIPRRKGTGEEVLTSLLNNVVRDPAKRRGINLILEDRRVKKTLNTYLLSPADYDGRMRTSFFICLDTGRSSTTQQEPPIRPAYKLVKENRKKKDTYLGAAFQTLTKHGDIGPEIRTMYVADKDHVFLQLDSSQAEARVIFKLADDEDALRDIDLRDYHAFTASWFFGGTEEMYSKKILGYEHPIRFAGKTLRHAGHLGEGKSRACIEVNTMARKYGIDFVISEAEAGKALGIFHARQPKIKRVFQAEVIKCLEKTRQLRSPVPYGINTKIGGIRTFFERWGDELFRQAFSYLPQRTVSENTKGAALRIRQRASWIRIAMESHDALLLHIHKDRAYDAAMIGREEMQRPIDFKTCCIERDKLIIPCDVEESGDYYGFKKFKFQEVLVK